jgi:hypothetical protein
MIIPQALDDSQNFGRFELRKEWDVDNKIFVHVKDKIPLKRF